MTQDNPGMETTSTVTPTRVLTPRELRILGKAAAVLGAVEIRAQSAAWDAPTDWRAEANPQDYGRLAEICDTAGDVLFRVVNVAENNTGHDGAISAYNKARETERARYAS